MGWCMGGKNQLAKPQKLFSQEVKGEYCVKVLE